MIDPNQLTKNFVDPLGNVRNIADQMRVAAGAIPSQTFEQLDGGSAIRALKELDAFNSAARDQIKLAGAGINGISAFDTAARGVADQMRIAAGAIPSHTF